MQIVYDGVYGIGTTGTPQPAKHNVKTGGQIPVEIIAEVDRKIDDGKPASRCIPVLGVHPDRELYRAADRHCDHWLHRLRDRSDQVEHR